MRARVDLSVAFARDRGGAGDRLVIGAMRGYRGGWVDLIVMR